MRNFQFCLVSILTVAHCAFAEDSVQLRIIHADPLTTRVAVSIDGVPTSKPLARRQSDTIKLPVAKHTITVANAETSESVTSQTALNMEPNHCYTVVIARETTAPESKATNVVVPVECKAPESGKANATFVLASPTVEKVDVYAGWFKIVNGLKSGHFEGPTPVPAGDYKVVAKENGKPVLGPIDLAPKAGLNYTIVAFDNPTGGDGEELTHRVYEDNFTTGSK